MLIRELFTHACVGRGEYVVTALQTLHLHLCALSSGNMMTGSSCWVIARTFVCRRRKFSVSILVFLQCSQLISFSEGKKKLFYQLLIVTVKRFRNIFRNKYNIGIGFSVI